MTDINKQKFLNELSRLLTFMYEEDRQTALNMYSEAFDYAEDPEALLLKLSSPTRQAVIIARSYDAKERKLQIHSQSRDEDGVYEPSDEVPAFIEAIENVLPEIPQYEAPEYEAESDEEIFAEESGAAPAEEEFHEEAVETEPAEEVYEEAAEAEPAEEVYEEAAEAEPAEEVFEEAAEAEPVEEVFEEAAEAEPVEEVFEEAAEAEPAEEVSEEGTCAAENETDNISLAEELAQDARESQEHFDADGIDDYEEEVSKAVANESEDSSKSEEEEFIIDSSAFSDVDINPEDGTYAQPTEPRIKANIPLLILFVILAVPVTLALIAVILIPAVISLAISCCAIYAGAVILVAAFGGFAVFADILVVLGLALIVLSLGLLFLTLFIWFIADVIVGLVKSVISLCRKWCFKEVSEL